MLFVEANAKLANISNKRVNNFMKNNFLFIKKCNFVFPQKTYYICKYITLSCRDINTKRNKEVNDKAD